MRRHQGSVGSNITLSPVTCHHTQYIMHTNLSSENSPSPSLMIKYLLIGSSEYNHNMRRSFTASVFLWRRRVVLLTPITAGH